MDDDKVRELLGRYRPVGPQPELRVVALHASSKERIWPWATAAAVLLMATAVLQNATTSALSRISPAVVDPTNALAEAMGGDEEAQRAAQLIVSSEQLFRGVKGQRNVNDELEELIDASR